MVEVGEQTGHLGEIFAQLAEHYENQVRLRRNFLSSITWPIIQLTIALAVIGLLIWIGGVIGQRAGGAADRLLWGSALSAIEDWSFIWRSWQSRPHCSSILILAASRGLIWVRPLQRAILARAGFGHLRCRRSPYRGLPGRCI